jgi:hypothetical protein
MVIPWRAVKGRRNARKGVGLGYCHPRLMGRANPNRKILPNPSAHSMKVRQVAGQVIAKQRIYSSVLRWRPQPEFLSETIMVELDSSLTL